MTITQQQKNTAAVFAILAGLVSIPLTWMTVRGPLLLSGLGNSLNLPIGQLNVTGVNGTITFLFKSPIWFIVGIAISANVIQLMQNSRQFAIPWFAGWVTSIFGVIWIGIGICVALFSDKATLGIGSLLGFFCAGVALFCVIVPTSTQQDSLSEIKGV